MKGIISINYDKALAQADKLARAREKCNQQINDMNAIIGQLRESWIGDSGNAMIEKCHEWIDSHKTQVSLLEETERRIRKTVEVIRNSDEEASRRIREQ